eukprot:s5564_g10.t3
MSAKRIEAGRKRDAPGYALEFRNFVKLVELLLMACLGAPTWHSRPEAFRRQDALQKQHLGPCHHGQHPRRGTAGSRGRRSGRMTVENSVLREGQQSVRPLRLSRKKPAGENSSYLSHSRHLHRRALPCPAPGIQEEAGDDHGPSHQNDGVSIGATSTTGNSFATAWMLAVHSRL